MNRQDLEEQVRDSFEAAGFDLAQLRVAADPYGGWRVRVVSDGFEEKGESERRALLSQAMKDEPLVWRQLLSPSEVQDAEPFPDVEEEQLPLWPESLARGSLRLNQAQAPIFLTDCVEELARPVTATFYSLRGGVGRSTALAITARLLAEQGLKVVCLDMDLEAPGLASLFGVEEKVAEQQGIVELLLALDQGLEPDFANHLLPLDDEGRLFLIPAGLPSAAYARDLRLLDPSAWYTETENPLRELLKGVRQRLPFIPDAILIDSRTGISAISAPLLFEQADAAVVVFYPNEQAKRGTQALVEGLLAANNHRGLDLEGHSAGPEVRFVVGPLPSSSPEIQKRLWHRALEWVAEWISPVQEPRLAAGLLELDEADMATDVPYREAVAATDRILDGGIAGAPYARIAGWISRLLPTAEEGQEALTSREDKLQILHDLHVDTGAAEDQQELLSVFIETEVVQRALKSECPVVLGRKGTGKTALFRCLEERPPEEADAVSIHPPQGRGKQNWHLSAAGFRILDEQLIQPGKMSWQSFWTAYILVGLGNSQGNRAYLSLIFREPHSLPTDAHSLIHWLDAFSNDPMASLHLEEALQQIDRDLDRPVFMLWDGLDVGFGSEKNDRARRERALVGLLALVIEWEKQLKNLRFKVMLREDLWRELRFENKSHLYGRAEALRWSHQFVFLKVVVKQLWRSGLLREHVKGKLPEFQQAIGLPVDQWSDQIMSHVWEQIVGARMSGGKSAFTRNWVWARLGDANDDHAPRHLLQLFRKAIDWEKKQEPQTSYRRSLLRPNALVKVLPEVSKQALDALLEEFVELTPLINALREIGKTPFNAGELEDMPNVSTDQLTLAREVGLLGIHEGTERAPDRYRIPELYRLDLAMARKGQA